MSEVFRQFIPPDQYKQHFSTIVFKTSFNNCVKMTLLNRKWKQLEAPDSEVSKQLPPAIQTGTNNQWNLQWCEKQRTNQVFNQGISGNQRINHFRLYTQLCRKDMLMKNVKKYKYELKKKKILNQQQWNFLPATYFLPSQYIMFAEQFKKSGGLWILKPTGRCQGSGIFLVDKLAQVAPYRNRQNFNSETNSAGINNSKSQRQPVLPKKIQKKPVITKKQKSQEQDEEQQQGEKQNTETEEQEQAQISQSFLIQKYIDKPLLFGNKKFDLRMYVLCTDYRNLTVWLYRSGFARFTHQPYNTDNIDNLGGHLTNVQIQKHCENYDIGRGGKWQLNQFKLYLFTKYGKQKVDQCFYNMKQIILNSLRAVQSKLLPSKSSFQLYGYDFMMDDQLKPWLIQVNGGPSMTANTNLDCQLKCGLVDDVLTIIDLEGLLKGNEMTVGGFDLIMKKDLKIREPSYSDYKTMLGTANQRLKVIKKLAINFLEHKRQQKVIQKNKALERQLKQRKYEKLNNNTKQKLLPSFYYERKQADTNDQVIKQLKQQLKILNRNAQFEEDNENQKKQQEMLTKIQFFPLKAIVSK